MRERVGHFHVGHPQFVKTVLQKSLFFRSQIAFGFLGDHAECVDGLSRADQIDARLSALLMHHSELHHRGHIERGHEALEAHREFFRRVSAQFDLRIKIARRLPVSIVLSLLIENAGRLGDIGFGRRWSTSGRGRRHC